MQVGFDKDERDLIGKAKEGNRSAFSQLVRPHLAPLLVLARRMLGSAEDAEDAVQTALASTWMARARLDTEHPIAPFLTTVTLNKCRDRIRRRKVARLVGLSDAIYTVSSDDPDQLRSAASRELLTRTAQAIERLPLKLREALVLVALDGRSQAEAAQLLGVTEKTIETRIYRARQKLREKVDFS